MRYNKLGQSDLNVRQLCLGSMTWGSQNSEAEGHTQIDMALSEGINFIDTAEMYPTTPHSPDTTGRTEEIIGTWIATSKRRDDIILATKVTGPGNKNVRGGEAISGESIRRAIDGSLKRLRTDYIDLYQLHWSNRGSYHMRQNWSFDPTKQEKGLIEDHVVDVLTTMTELQREGKIRELGLSNETVWGTAKFLSISEREHLIRPISMQNEYSLLCRHFDLDFAELCHHEDVGLLAWSPLAAGLLSGKYESGDIPSGSRRSMQNDLNKRASPQSEAATAAYSALARDHGMEPAQMAIAFCLTRPFCASAIIGATDLDQLTIDIKAAQIELTADVLAGIEAIRREYPTPM